MSTSSIAILGCGNIGSSIAKGLANSGVKTNDIIVTRRKAKLLSDFKNQGFIVADDNIEAVKKSKIIILAVGPNQIMDLLDEIASSIKKDILVISIVSGVKISELKYKLDKNIPIIRAMPNTAAVLGESMTCIASSDKNEQNLHSARELFNRLGQTLIIDEEQMSSATALCACGVAFFLRAIRAASQGGIEIGFHSDEAFTIAAQTARGAASLLLDNAAHPEAEIDRVTTPMGATISGLNEMEHQGFSSAMIKGITTSTDKITKLFNKEK